MEAASMISSFIVVLLIVEAVLGACPKVVTKEVREFNITNDIATLKTVGLYEPYEKCIKRTVDIFGTDWMDEVCKHFDENGMFTFIPFPYSFQVYCENKGLGVVDEKTHLQDDALYAKVISEKLKDDKYSEMKTEYLAFAKCIGKCNNGETTNPNIPVGVPTHEQMKNEHVTDDYVKYAGKAHNIDICSMHCGWPNFSDAHVYQWAEAFYREILKTA